MMSITLDVLLYLTALLSSWLETRLNTQICKINRQCLQRIFDLTYNRITIVFYASDPVRQSRP